MRPERCNSWCSYDGWKATTCKHCGWPRNAPHKPASGENMPEIYDIEHDLQREATQADIDMLGAVARAYARARRDMEAAHAELQATLKQIRSEAGLPA